MNLPKSFIEKMSQILGDNTPNFFASLDKPSEKAITVNFNRLGNNDFNSLCDFDIEKIEKVENGYYVKDLKFSKNILNHLGIIYSQEPSAMYPVEMLDIKEGDIVLDACAAPGGKSVQILEKLNGKGFLLSNEIVYKRCQILYENLNRMGFKNFAISCNSTKELSKCDTQFDKILVDAPCGGEGMFRKENFNTNDYHPESIDSNALRQLEILENIKNLLKPGGTLVYSTCTYDTRENEEVVARFLETNKDFHLTHTEGFESVTTEGIKIGNTYTNLCYRRYPHLHRGEGQFMAILQKEGISEICNSTYSNANYQKLTNKDKKILSDNLSHICDISRLEIAKKNNIYYAISNNIIPLNNLNITSIGCVVGSLDGKVLKIDHNFYHTYGDLFYNQINLSKDEIFKYLHGEEIETEGQNGICVITYKDIALGGGKIVNGKLKNYYPKNLRI